MTKCKTQTPRRRKNELQLCRDRDATYAFFKPTAKLILRRTDLWGGERASDYLGSFYVDMWHAATNKTLHLKLGGGPIRIRIERVEDD